MEHLEELMSKRKWIKHSLRTDVAQPDETQQCGKVRVAKIYSNLVRTREKEPDIYGAINESAPEWWGEETLITLTTRLDLQETHGWKQGALLVIVARQLYRRRTAL